MGGTFGQLGCDHSVRVIPLPNLTQEMRNGSALHCGRRGRMRGGCDMAIGDLHSLVERNETHARFLDFGGFFGDTLRIVQSDLDWWIGGGGCSVQSYTCSKVITGR